MTSAPPMTGLHEVACGACGKRHVMSAARARSQRVLRCDCGQFVRLDRTLGETRSEPPPAPEPAGADANDDDDDETHMLSSLEAIAALGATAGGRASRASFSEEDDAAPIRATSSAGNLPPAPSTPPPRPSSPVRRPSSPTQSAITPAAEKPLWYVDLGGAETVEMTIEQLIIARRSGKLGEGALVWRAGMPRWRSVGSLIPTAGSGAPRQTVSPAAPVRPKQPPPQTLGSYERPLATLEFALERRPASGPPPQRAPTPIPRTPLPSAFPSARGASQVGPLRARGASQVGPLPARGASQVGPLPAPAPLPVSSRTTATPLPPLPTPPARATVPPILQRSSPRPPPRPSLVPAALQPQWGGQRPRWVSIGIAVLICITASGSGAFVVRTLKIRRQPLSLSPMQLSAAPPVTSPAPLTGSVPTALPAAASSTEIVDVDSLSVERRAPRAAVRPAAPVMRVAPVIPVMPVAPVAPAVTAVAPVAPALAPNADKNTESAGQDEMSPTAVTPSPTAKKTKNGDLPAVAHSNPDTSGAVDDSNPKKPAPSSGDEPGF